MLTSRQVPVLAIVLAVATGCGSDGSRGMKAFSPTEGEKQNATAMATQTAGLQDLKSAEATGDTGRQKVAMIGLTSQNVFSSQQGRNDGSVKSALASALSVASALEDDACVTKTETRTTYANCVSGSTTTDGFIEIAGDTFTIDLSSVSQGDADATTIFQGSLTVTATLIDGTFRYKVDSQQGSSYMKYDITTTYEGITLADGCPTAGVLLVDGSMDVNFEGLGAGTDEAAVQVTFGPACGDMAMIGG